MLLLLLLTVCYTATKFQFVFFCSLLILHWHNFVSLCVSLSRKKVFFATESGKFHFETALTLSFGITMRFGECFWLIYCRLRWMSRCCMGICSFDRNMVKLIEHKRYAVFLGDMLCGGKFLEESMKYEIFLFFLFFYWRNSLKFLSEFFEIILLTKFSLATQDKKNAYNCNNRRNQRKSWKTNNSDNCYVGVNLCYF